MNILLRKGSGYSADYTSTDYPVLVSGWVGTFSLFATYPGVATFSKALTRVGNVLRLDLTAQEIVALPVGVYTTEITFTNTALGESITSIDYASVLDVMVSDQPMTLLTMTIGKADGTPAGAPTQSMGNTVDGIALFLGWKGVQVKAVVADAFNIGTEIIGTETVSTETNAAGYAQLVVIKGSTVTVTCPSFGKSVTVDTTGLDTIDLSTYF